jgi:hypothetical protein
MREYLEYLDQFDRDFVFSSTSLNDPIPDASDYIYSNSPILNTYQKGHIFRIDDHEIFYQIIKAIKDYTDIHFYENNFKYELNASEGQLKIILNIPRNGSEIWNEHPVYFIEVFIQYISQIINNSYPDCFQIIQGKEISVNKDEIYYTILIKHTNKQCKFKAT